MIEFREVFMMVGLVGRFVFGGVGWVWVLVMFICGGGLFGVCGGEELVLVEKWRGREMMGGGCVEIGLNLGNGVGG